MDKHPRINALIFIISIVMFFGCTIACGWELGNLVNLLPKEAKIYISNAIIAAMSAWLFKVIGVNVKL